jgi:flagellar hook-length control protein FliK
MHIDISTVPAPSTPDAACASAELPADVSDAFAALLDEAACECDKGKADETDEEDCFDELAALAMTSLLCLGGPVPPAPADDKPASDTCDHCTAQEITDKAQETTDKAVATDLIDRAAIVESGWSSMLTTIGRDMSAGQSIDPVKGDALGNTAAVETTPKATPKATQKTAPTTTQGTTSEMTTADAVEASLAAPTAQAETPVDTTGVTGAEDAFARETKASTGKVDADVKPAKAARAEKPQRSEPAGARHTSQELDVRAVQAASSTAAGPQAEDVRSEARAPQAPVERGTGSPAARLARALERVAAWTTRDAADTAPGSNAGSGDGGQPSGFGDAASNRAAQFSEAIRQSVANTTPFVVHAPAPIEMRSPAAAAAAGHALDHAPMTIPERDVIAQLVQSLRVQFRDGIGEAVLKLKPEHLGSVQISLRVENGAIKATVQAEAPAVRQWLESHQDTLRTGLAEQGLRLDRFVVEPEGEPKRATDERNRQREQEQQRRRQQRRRQSENDPPVFEVTV